MERMICLKTEKIALLSGIDIPIYSLQLSLHQPTIKELSYMSEKGFWVACEIIKFSKDRILKEDKSGLEKLTNFDIIMTMMNGKEPTQVTNRTYVHMLMTLLFPDQEVIFQKNRIDFKDSQGNVRSLTSQNFEQFKEVFKDVFCLTESAEDTYNPSGDLSAQIAKKFEERKKKLQELKGDKGDQNISVFGRYASILAVGESKDINSLFGYTVYQLLNEFNRYRLKLAYDTYLQLACAGGKPKDEPEDWMKDID